ncbi:hypothetical protein S40288_05082 [Stachybotrys chartarum IBT 40288]|nr:hypothetical protein S40288_05082 [Stachybotrys chartarum IBT 40288]
MASEPPPQQPSEPPPWWAALPEPQSSSPHVEASQVLQLLQADKSAHRTQQFLLIDVRRTDWEGGTISTSLNLPAQSFYHTRPVLYRLAHQAGINQLIFYCGSSNGRGPRCAGWMQDYLNEVGEKNITALVLKGGIKGWQRTYGGKFMDNYDEKAWAEVSK